MAASKTKLAQSVSADELKGILEELRDVPRADLAARIVEIAERHGVEIGLTSAYAFREKEFDAYLASIEKTKRLADFIAHEADASAGSTLADAAAGMLSQGVFEFLAEAGTEIDLESPEGIKQAESLSRILKSLRSEDRKQIADLREALDAAEKREKEAKEIVGDNKLTTEERTKRMRAHFGIPSK